MPSKFLRLRRLLNQCIFALVVIFMVSGCRQSSQIPAEIVGDSMAPLLCGTHLRESCLQCDFSFDYSSNQDVQSVQCPNCGSQFPSQGTSLPADSVSVMPNRSPRRWDIVAFEHGDNTMIKRVVGLPGESVSIASGNILIDGNLVAKPHNIAVQTQHFVFDSAFHNHNTPPRLELNAKHWNQRSGAVEHRSRDAVASKIDWISYRHQRNYPHHAASSPQSWPAIEDNNGYNQNVGRKLKVVNELAVQLDLTLQNGTTFVLQRTVGHNHLEANDANFAPLATYRLKLTVDEDLPQYRGTLTRGDFQATFSGRIPKLMDRTFKVSLSASDFDRRIKIALDEVVKIDVSASFDSPAAKGTLNQQLDGASFSAPYLKFGFSPSSIGSVNRCRIWRDIHYFSETAPPEFQLPITLDQESYFVLGDNTAISRDSRHFGPIKKVIGTVQQ